MNIDLMNPGSDDPPHYVVSPSNEYERRMLAAIYEFHKANNILMTKATGEDLGLRRPLPKGKAIDTID